MKKRDFLSRLRMHLDFVGENQCWKWLPEWRDADLERVCVQGKRVLVRRYVYERVLEMGHGLAGPLAKNQPLVRTCDTEGCFNPWHQVPAISTVELARSGEWRGAPNDPRGAHNRNKTHCRYGHPYSPGNVSYTRDGRRRCKACHRERAWLPLDMRWIVHGFREGQDSPVAAMLARHMRRGG